jgi:Bacterial aa3 type cytochrome c oxidase subunit IV
MAKAAANTADKDFEEHRRTFSLFTGMVKWGIISLAILMVLLYILVRP